MQCVTNHKCCVNISTASTADLTEQKIMTHFIFAFVKLLIV